MQQWCKLGATILLLACEVTISHLCQSYIILVDGFHTLFVLIHMTLSPWCTDPPLSSLDLPASPPHISSAAIKPLPDTQATGDGSTPDQPPTPSSLSCGLSYTSCRIQTLGGFLSALVLASLCFSAVIEVINLFVVPKPVQHPLVLVAVSTGSLLYKMLVLWLNWDQQQGPETESLIEVNHKGNNTCALDIQWPQQKPQNIGHCSQNLICLQMILIGSRGGKEARTDD